MSSADGQDRSGLVTSVDAAALGSAAMTPLVTRLTVIFFSTAFLLILISSAILYWGMIAALQGADDQVVDKRAETVIDILTSKELNDGLLAHEVNEDNQGPRQIFIRVVSSYVPIALETEGMSQLLSSSEFPDAGKAPLRVPVRSSIRMKDDRTYRVATFKVPLVAKPDASPVILQVATDTSLDDSVHAHFRWILAIVLGSAFPLSALTAWYIARRELRPLTRIARAFQAIDGARLDQRINLANMPAELHNLAVHFNSMLSRLENTWSDLRHYADTIAHEMRTPLNRMRLDCEIAINKSATGDEFREVMTSTVSECERLTRLLQGLLFLARAESKQAKIIPKMQLLDTSLLKLREYFEADTSESGIELTINCEYGLAVNADGDLLQQAIANVISNAVAHTPRSGMISIDAKRQGENAVIALSDTGSGIAPQHVARIFDRFYRADSQEHGSNRSERLGLGLHLSKSIVELHGGSISVASELGKGTRVTISIPAALDPVTVQAPPVANNCVSPQTAQSHSA